MSLSSVSHSALELPLKDRAALIDQLFESIDSELEKNGPTDLLGRWADESEERIQAVERGELKTVDGPTVLGELRRLARK